MNAKQLEKANIDNLTNLWKLLGYKQCIFAAHRRVNVSLDWPHRVWLDWEAQPTAADMVAMAATIGQAADTAVFPTWHPIDIETLQEKGFTPLFEQTAMVCHLHHDIKWETSELAFKEVTSQEETAVWAEIASQSFGYYIPPVVIQNVVGTPKLKFILGYLDDEPVVTTLIFENSHVAGVHLVGVPPQFRRRGYARKIMHHILFLVQQSGIEYATLQASALGKPLYESLGFEKQFVLTNFAFGRR